MNRLSIQERILFNVAAAAREEEKSLYNRLFNDYVSKLPDAPKTAFSLGLKHMAFTSAVGFMSAVVVVLATWPLKITFTDTDYNLTEVAFLCESTGSVWTAIMPSWRPGLSAFLEALYLYGGAGFFGWSIHHRRIILGACLLPICILGAIPTTDLLYWHIATASVNVLNCCLIVSAYGHQETMCKRCVMFVTLFAIWAMPLVLVQVIKQTPALLSSDPIIGHLVAMGVMTAAKMVDFMLKALVNAFPTLPMEKLSVFFFAVEFNILVAFRQVTMDPDVDIASAIGLILSVAVVQVLLRLVIVRYTVYNLARLSRGGHDDALLKLVIGRYLLLVRQESAADFLAEQTATFTVTAMLIMSTLSPLGIAGTQVESWASVLLIFGVQVIVELVCDQASLVIIARYLAIHPSEVFMNADRMVWVGLASVIVICVGIIFDIRPECLFCVSFDEDLCVF